MEGSEGICDFNGDCDYDFDGEKFFCEYVHKSQFSCPRVSEQFFALFCVRHKKKINNNNDINNNNNKKNEKNKMH